VGLARELGNADDSVGHTSGQWGTKGKENGTSWYYPRRAHTKFWGLAKLGPKIWSSVLHHLHGLGLLPASALRLSFPFVPHCPYSWPKLAP